MKAPIRESKIKSLEGELACREQQYLKLQEATNLFGPTTSSFEGCNWRTENTKIYHELSELGYKLAGNIQKLRLKIEALRGVF